MQAALNSIKTINPDDAFTGKQCSKLLISFMWRETRFILAKGSNKHPALFQFSLGCAFLLLCAIPQAENVEMAIAGWRIRSDAMSQI